MIPSNLRCFSLLKTTPWPFKGYELPRKVFKTQQARMLQDATPFVRSHASLSQNNLFPGKRKYRIITRKISEGG